MTSPYSRGQVGDTFTGVIDNGYATPPDNFYNLRRIGLLPGGPQPDQAQVAYSDGYGKDPMLVRVHEDLIHQTQSAYMAKLVDYQHVLSQAEDAKARAQANATAMHQLAEHRRRALQWLLDSFDFYEKDSDTELMVHAVEVIKYAIDPEYIHTEQSREF